MEEAIIKEAMMEEVKIEGAIIEEVNLEAIMDETMMEEINLDDEAIIDEERMMEECIICFDETDKFIIFICNHKTCHKCYPLLMEQRPNCPLCNKLLLPAPRVIPFTMVTPFTRETRTVESSPTCKLFAIVMIIGSILFYILAVGGSVFLSENNNS
jgi:hypothetical protein